ncbi:hypothetical protein CCHR01_13472 [Colletotrichum chrysophilum]|uniref:Uncharacterized protein n=1 Tax=Colletotrichum chrysophilum TaxID=1836956 RepID=A0AAD9ABF2_9PEZI|nr:hypothetical protein CCHR01_13472 [Colletotrichum chrysophilum]
MTMTGLGLSFESPCIPCTNARDPWTLKQTLKDRLQRRPKGLHAHVNCQRGWMNIGLDFGRSG